MNLPNRNERTLKGQALAAYLIALSLMYRHPVIRDSGLIMHTVTAASADIHGEHLVFLDSTGKLAALFLLEIVESWSEMPNGR